MGVLLIFMFVCFFIAYLTGKSLEKDKKKLKDQGIHKRIGFMYCGGDEEIVRDCSVVMNWKDEGIQIDFRTPMSSIKTELVTYKDILSFSGVTENQIRSDVTLSRLAIFGTYAFAMKKDKVSNTYFIIFKYLKNGLQKELILSSEEEIQGRLTDSIKMLNEHKAKVSNLE